MHASWSKPSLQAADLVFLQTDRISLYVWPQVGATDSEDEAESGEDLDRIEAAAAAINQRLPPSPAAQPHEDIQVCHWPRYRKKRKGYTLRC